MTDQPYLTTTFLSSQTEEIQGYMEEQFHEGYRLNSINDWENKTYWAGGETNGAMYCRVTMEHTSVRTAS